MKRFLGTAELTHNCFWFNGIAKCVTIYCTCTISGYEYNKWGECTCNMQ